MTITSDPQRLSSKLVEALVRVGSNTATSATLPPHCYVDAGVLSIELDTLFMKGYVAAGRSDHYAQPGDYRTLNLGSTGIIVVRSDAGSIKAFANVCRHRASQLLQGSGNCRRIRCPFHSWSYDLNGHLSYAPSMEGVKLDPLRYGLKEFSVVEKCGFVFVHPDHSVDERQWFGDFDAIHDPWQLADWESTRIREFNAQCNWKSFIEVFNEYYHLPYVHPRSINHYYAVPDPLDPVRGCYTTQFGETAGNAALLEEDQHSSLPTASTLHGRAKRGIRYTWVYPNLTFAASPDCLWIYETYPLSADSSRVVQTVCFPENSVSHENFDRLANHYYRRIDQAIDEDLPFLEQQQRGFASSFAEQGVYSSLEPSVAKFAQWYAGKMLAAG
jgi:phenylpropionate dioxygenase-like ring-hydroxylating dioxygenase large terminal subunit